MYFCEVSHIILTEIPEKFKYVLYSDISKTILTQRKKKLNKKDEELFVSSGVCLTEHPSKSVSTRNGHQSKQATRVNSGFDTWGLGT